MSYEWYNTERLFFVVMSSTTFDDQSVYYRSLGMSVLGDTTNGVTHGFGIEGDSVQYNRGSTVDGTHNAVDDATHMLAMTYSSSSGDTSVYHDGLLSRSATVGSGGGNYGVIGRSYGENSYYGGDIAEIIVFDEVLTNAERMEVENYLRGKWEVDMTVANLIAIPEIAAVYDPVDLIGADYVPGSDPRTIASVSNVIGETAVLNQDGTVIFTASHGVSGPAGFDYEISDGSGEIEAARAFVEVWTTATGDSEANILVGGEGDDILIGSEGADTLYGGGDLAVYEIGGRGADKVVIQDWFAAGATPGGRPDRHWRRTRP